MKQIKKCILFTLVAAMCFILTCTAFAEDLPAGTTDLGTMETLPDSDNAEYYQQLLDNEKYNYRVLRNIPAAFGADEFDQYINLVEKAIRGSRLGEKQCGLLDETLAFRQNMKRVRSCEDSMWMIWGDLMPGTEAEAVLDFTDCYDNPGFRPFLVPYLLEDQNNVKGNLIIIAGGGYSGRNNKTEGYPIADAFSALGYNCYVLQRRVEPYSPEDSWMDLQRAVRFVRKEVDARGLGGGDCIAAAGFSGGSATVIGCIEYYYGSITPDATDPDYIPDEIDSLSGDLDVALCIYGPNPAASHDGTYEGLVTDNENLPAMFLAAGLNDNTGAQFDNLTLANSLNGRTLVEYHAFANTPHGFGVGTKGTNSPYWIPMADGFVDQAMAAVKTAE